jgi:hypothetical protein
MPWLGGVVVPLYYLERLMDAVVSVRLAKTTRWTRQL